jgi:hypothetical protein
VKIGSFPNNVIPIGSAGVRSKRSEGEGGNARQQYDPNQTRRDGEGSSGDPGGDSRKEGKQEAFDPKLIDDALESFKTDASAQEHGLSAEAEGSGPGLKINVKDCNGTTLRQFSGEEFLRLREASTAQASAFKSPAKRGKILDQKL